VRRGGVVVACDHTADPDESAARWQHEIERARDRTHTRSLTPGGLVDLLSQVGLRDVRLVEEPFDLDFDEWFDRGSPSLPKEEVRRMLASGSARGFRPALRPDGGITIHNLRALVRGERA